MSPSSSVSTITTDQVMKQSTHTIHKQDHYSTTNLSTIESSSAFVTPAASLAMPLSRTLSNPLSLQNMNLDNDSDEENDSLKKSDDDLSERLKELQNQDLAAFLPISSGQNRLLI